MDARALRITSSHITVVSRHIVKDTQSIIISCPLSEIIGDVRVVSISVDQDADSARRSSCSLLRSYANTESLAHAHGRFCRVPKIRLHTAQLIKIPACPVYQNTRASEKPERLSQVGTEVDIVTGSIKNYPEAHLSDALRKGPGLVDSVAVPMVQEAESPQT